MNKTSLIGLEKQLSALWLRSVVVSAEDMGSALESIYTLAQYLSEPQFQESLHSLLTSVGTRQVCST